MSRKELDLVQSEISTLEDLLAGLAPGRIIERMGFAARLEDARARLVELESRSLAKPLPITFRGAPVDGSRSIDAGFAATALKAFIEATDTVAASLAKDDLKRRGPLPHTSGRSLRIVHTALGSFGFELELPPMPVEHEAQRVLELQLDPAPPGDPYEQAIAAIFDLIAGAAARDEREVSSLVADIHPRAAGKVRSFVRVLADAQALVAAEFEGKRVRLDDAGQVQRVLEALREEDISERTEDREGVLLGVLPESRRFECRLSNGALVTGKVDRSVADITTLQSRWERRTAVFRFRIVSVRGNEAVVLVEASEPSGAAGP